MGYYASGGGEILLQKDNIAGFRAVAASLGIKEEDVSKHILEKIHEIFGEEADFDQCEEGYKITVYYQYSHYHGEDIEDLLYLLKPLMKAGTQIEFTGEDNSFWAFISDLDGEWKECSGQIIYEGPRCTENCVYAHRGKCRYHAVFGRYPVRNHLCEGYITAENRG